MSGIHDKAGKAVDVIEAELRRIGRWSEHRPPDAAFVDMGAFGMKTLSPEQWLQFVLVPNVRDIIVQRGAFPRSSAVSVWAFRNFDGDPDADQLLGLLGEFDALFEGDLGGDPAPPSGPSSNGTGAPPPDDAKLSRLTARLVQALSTMPTVKAAYLAQLYFPSSGQLTTPILGLEVDGPLAADALGGLPAHDPFVAMIVADDAVSRMLRMGSPFYTRQ
jgi:uncharacterized protein YqcC (DUF446 family)